MDSSWWKREESAKASRRLRGRMVDGRVSGLVVPSLALHHRSCLDDAPRDQIWQKCCDASSRSGPGRVVRGLPWYRRTYTCLILGRSSLSHHRAPHLATALPFLSRASPSSRESNRCTSPAEFCLTLENVF